MSFQARSERRGKCLIHILDNPGLGQRAEICPEKGFNCFGWTVRGVDFLYADPGFLEGSSPTRTGIPILFPFPNRIRNGKFTWEGRNYSLPVNDSTRKNAIHGFACRRPWRVVDSGADGTSAWVTGEFRGSADAADCRELWPADYLLRITYRLLDRMLRIEARVENPGPKALPFGLGYHHYYCIPGEEAMVQVPAARFWELNECLPTGRRQKLEAGRDLNQPRKFSELNLDDVLTDLPGEAGPEGLCFRGRVRHGSGLEVRMSASPAFRETVVFTPPHRQAFCIEPYTCVTDAVNLQQGGTDAGWVVLPAGGNWSAMVLMESRETQ